MQNMLPLLLILVPLAGALGCGTLERHRDKLRNWLANCTSFTVLVLACSLYPQVVQGTAEFSLPGFLGIGLFFNVDYLGFVFIVFISIIWALATLYATEYLRKDDSATRFNVFLLLTLAGCIGVFLAADFFTLFLFFEAMTLSSYVLVVHKQTEEAHAAGRSYLYMGIFGGLCLLSAQLLLLNYTGSLSFLPNIESLAVLNQARPLIAVLFFVGFGIKATAVPLHIWIPGAYEHAPPLVNALSSAAMLKAGAYGLIRVFNLLYTSHSGETVAAAESLGYLLIWAGVITLATGAWLALMQKSILRTLAYSSVSQMGYILMGIGVTSYLGYEGAMGFAGTSYHIINHAFFKAALFFLAGAVVMRTGSAQFKDLGGLWRRFPVITIVFFTAAAAISGIPGFNGYVSKTLLHHGIVEAASHHGSTALFGAEKIFVITGGLTFCYMLRMFLAIFTGPADTPVFKLAGETWLERIIFATFGVIIIAGGLLPTQIIQHIIVPMSRVFTFDSYTVAHLSDICIWNIHDLGGITVSLVIGTIVFLFLYRIDFQLGLPEGLSIERMVYQPALTILLFGFAATGMIIEIFSVAVLVSSVRPMGRLAHAVVGIEGTFLPMLGERLLALMTAVREYIYSSSIVGVRELQNYIQQAEYSAFHTLIKLDYNPRGEQLYRKLTLMNMDLCVFIVVITLVTAFSVWFLRMIGL
ncbi:MAG: NADH dehydrogenase subunit [Clostridiales bacterium]|jgi:formate hydrogenlyase subunit 3/multisubunit Na+/H+ antiporter MnhD subunit|nr:NADH dehydrogenase subunit [Clostridiales bacterium]